MRRLVQLVQAAKGMCVCCKEEATGGLAYYTAGISEYTYLHTFLTTYCPVFKRASCRFLVSPARHNIHIS